MDESGLLNALLDLAEEMGIEVRRDFLGGEGGGLCRLKGKWVLFVDTAGSAAEQLATAAGALAGREELEEKYIVPQLREVLDAYRETE